MAIRAGVQYIVEFVAELVNDSDFEFHTPESIQAELDRWRWEARYADLQRVETRAAGTGTISYLIWCSEGDSWRFWESDSVLVDSTYTALSPTTRDDKIGRWEFAAEPSNLPVRIVGFSHDPYAAAASLLMPFASAGTNKPISFSVGNGSFAYQSRLKDPMMIADRYWAMARNQDSLMVRTDVW